MNNPMKLTNQDAVAAVDADFAEMAIAVGQHAWGLPQLSMREKAFVFLAADMCAHGLGFPLQTHVEMARSQGVSMPALRETVRHLAPYVGYPTAAEALARLGEIEATPPGQPQHQSTERLDPDDRLIQQIASLDKQFAEFFTGQFADRWGRPDLSIRERALATIATDVLGGTLDESLRMHVELALGNGAEAEQIRAVLLLVAEFGIAKAWQAYRALSEILDPHDPQTG